MEFVPSTWVYEKYDAGRQSYMANGITIIINFAFKRGKDKKYLNCVIRDRTHSNKQLDP